MVEPIREHAGVLSLAVEHGFADYREAIDWACELVAEQTDPMPELIDLAGVIRPHPLDVVRLLQRIAGSADRARVFRRLLARIRDALCMDPGALPFAHVTRFLEQMAIAGEVPKPLEGSCYWFDDARLLAEQGISGDPDSVRAELLAFLDAEADPG